MPKIKNDLSGKIFGRLTANNHAGFAVSNLNNKRRSVWNCKCSCGNIVLIRENGLLTGNTRSCGCLHKEQSKINASAVHISNIKYNPIIFSAKSIWWATYKENDGVSFDEFYKMSQQNCFYCNSEPNTKYNRFNKANATFIYNGLDRVNSKFGHVSDNVVACCKICNRAKGNKLISNFNQYIINLMSADRISPDSYRSLHHNILMCDLNEKYLGSSIKTTFKCSYNDSGLSINQFYKLSQLNCYYCSQSPNNKANKSKKDGGDYIYNGLDRLDNSISHCYSNVVPCCKSCNFAKSNLSFDDFMYWIGKLKSNHSNLQIKINTMLGNIQ